MDGSLSQFFAYPPAFSGGASVALGDVNGDGLADIITGAGAGAGPHVKVFDGNTQASLGNFFAFTPQFAGGVNVAVGDVNGDGQSDIVVGTASASPHVRVFDGNTLTVLTEFSPFTPSFTGGVRVATGDVNNDGVDEIIVGAGPGAGPHVKVFNGQNNTELASFFAYAVSFNGGVFVASGDVNGDGRADVITGAGSGGGPHVKVFSGQTFSELASFFPFPPGFNGGVTVGSLDADGDGDADIVVGTGQGAAEVKIFDGETLNLLDAFLPFNTFDGGIAIGCVPVERQPFVAETLGLRLNS